MSDEGKAIEYLKRALVDLSETRRRLYEAESRFTEPIAIVGMGCRYPGGVHSPDDLWELVSAGRDAISGLPDNRGWEPEMLHDVESEEVDTGNYGGFLHDACDFDAEFFGIEEYEALMMDPQQRLLLETAWEACEDAGVDPTALKGSSAGVFVGASAQSYAAWLSGVVSECSEGYIASGNAGSMVSGRLAHVLELDGPAITVDTACSSSAVALHLACQSLRAGECSMALAGGVTVISIPWFYREFKRQHLFTLSDDGRCKPFADGADGTVFSEGVGVVVLERLSDARRLEHDVLAIVRGSAMNQDGGSNNRLTVPNGIAHERVIRLALNSAGVSADQVDAVEAHGLGTILGDSIEAQALLATYGQDRDSERPLWLGSLKSNVGSTQAAGGVGGVIKMVMAMRHGRLPKTLYVDTPSRHVDWSSGAVSLLVESVPWIKTDDVRRAAVDSFGMSGTNVHIILEQPTPAGRSVKDEAQAECDMVIGAGEAVPWMISGRGEGGLRRQVRRLAELVEERPELDVTDIGYSLSVSRAALSHRAVVIGSDRERLLEALREVAKGPPGPTVVEGIAHAGRDRVVFVLTRCETQWIELAMSLVESSPMFAAEIRRIDVALSRLVGWSLDDVLRGGVTRLEQESADILDLVDFAVTVSLAALWQACGVKPSAVVGHGPGEIAAAYIAGALTIEDAIGVVEMHDSTGLRTAALRGAANVPLWLTSIGGLVESEQQGGGHWSPVASDLSGPDAVMSALFAKGCRAFVEVGSSLVVSATLPTEAVVVPAVRPNDDVLQGIFASLAQLWVAGTAVDWRAVFAGLGARRVRLPTYAFDSRRYWLERSPTLVESDHGE
jgi:acyl transferase domain-containing protein